uniref:SH3 domain-containing protein n=1 Tax=Amphiprion ocellaris TaxID=80972 RepID=A0AAQ5ZHX6_AMPOC
MKNYQLQSKALYDNTAECADELAFRKGDIVTVMDQNVAGTSGWWMCSLYGRHGLAPANRLKLLPQSGTTAGSVCHVAEKPKLTHAKAGDCVQNIYQIPSVPRPTNSPAYEPTLPVNPNITACLSCLHTLPNPRKPEWIYDVPVGPEKLSPTQGSYDTMPSKADCKQLYDTLPAHSMPLQRDSPPSSLYDIPKSNALDIPSPPRVLPRAPLPNKHSPQSFTEELVYAVPPKEEPLTRVVNNAPSDAPSDHKPLECRGDSKNIYELKKMRLKRMRNFLACTSFRELPGSGESSVQEDERGRTLLLTSADSQRISTASSSSTSSCDSLALSSSSPEPLRELTLSQDEACRRLLELQESVCKAVPQLMDFVSSNWRCKEHLEKHLKEVREAAEAIACSLTCFLNFALDVKGNARRLTDTNLQTRLYKQLSIIEDSGVILQQTVSALNMAGWPLNMLCQDPGQIQTPDQLERFVMVARTVPEDVKRLVSIINANGKLLFRAPQKDPESMNTTDPSETKKSPDGTEQGGDLEEDDNDYVELQQKDAQKEPKENITPTTNTAQVSMSYLKKADDKRNSSDSGRGTEHRPPSLSEHCRLYFGALQKAIGGFVGSLQDGQPPEQFISQSKLVIMVGQRLVDTLCREAHRGGSSKSLLCKSNHLCALLKQLAVATKKAALHFPDQQALHEAQEFAKELAQRAQHFRISLDL